MMFDFPRFSCNYVIHPSLTLQTLLPVCCHNLRVFHLHVKYRFSFPSRLFSGQTYRLRNRGDAYFLFLRPVCLQRNNFFSNGTTNLPWFKSGAEDIASNYRPISVSSHFSKIIEKPTHKNLVSFLKIL